MAFTFMSRPKRTTSSSSKPVSKRKSAFGRCPGFETRALQRDTVAAPTRPLIQTKLRIGEPNDKFERQADRVAETVMRGERPASNVGPFTGLPTRTSRAPAGLGAQGNNLGGQALSPSLRGLFEPRFGSHFGHVRIHTDERAARAAGLLRARAFTMGSNIVFGDGEFAPETTAGRALLAHELTHTLQQEGPASDHSAARSLMSTSAQAPLIQRQATQSAPDVTAQDVFPFPKGSRVGLANIVPEGMMFDLLSALLPGLAAALKTIHGQEATVLTSTPDLFEAHITGPLTIPASKGQEARTVRDIILSLRRTKSTFEFSLTGVEGEQTERTSLIPLEEFGSLSGLMAKKEGNAIVLSRGSDATLEPLLHVSRGESEEVLVKVFSEAVVGAQMGSEPTINVIALKRLPDAETNAEAGSAHSHATDRVRHP